MADIFSLDDILEEYSKKANAKNDDELSVEKLLSDPLGSRRSLRAAADELEKASINSQSGDETAQNSEKPESEQAESSETSDNAEENAAEAEAEVQAENVEELKAAVEDASKQEVQETAESETAEPKTAQAESEVEEALESEQTDDEVLDDEQAKIEADINAEANAILSSAREELSAQKHHADEPKAEPVPEVVSVSEQQTGIDNVDVDTLVEAAVSDVETTDEPITPVSQAAEQSPKEDFSDTMLDMNIKLDTVSYKSYVEQEFDEDDYTEEMVEPNEVADTDFGKIIAEQEKPETQPEHLNHLKIKKTFGNTAIIEGLSKLIREKKPAAKDTGVTPVKRLRIKDVDLNLGKKLIPKTEQFERIKEEDVSFPKDASYTMKMKILSDRRKNKIRNFVLHTDDRDDEETEHEVENTIGDLTDYKNAPKVLSNIISLKNNLTIRLCVLIFTSLFTVYISLANDLGWPIIDAFKRTNDTTYLITNVVLGLISAFVSYTVITAGIKKLIKRQADCDSVAAISIVSAVVVSLISMLDTAMMQTKSYNLYMSVAVLSLLFNTLGKLLIVNRTLRNFRYVAGEFDKYALTNIVNEDVAAKFTKGALNDFPELVTMRKTEFNENFLKNSYSTDAADRFSKTYAPLILIVSLVVGLLALVCDRTATTFGQRIISAFITFSGTVSMVSTFSLMFVVNLPLERASKKYLQSSAVMLGYSAVEDFSDTNSVLVNARQLFPEGMINLVNLKAMSSASIEESILLAASLACQADSVLKPTFYNMLKGKTELLYPVESYMYEDGLGLSGWIENKRVLLGTRELMENHSIEGLPTKTRERDYTHSFIPVYLSVGGVVAALFVIRANASISVKKWLQTLERDGVATVIRSVDGFISLGFLSELFEIHPDSIKLLPFRFHREYEQETGFTERAKSSMLCSGHFPSFAMLIDGVKRLQFIANVGVTVQMAAALLGGLISLVMTIFGTFSGLSASIVILYNLIWFAVTVISQYIKRL